VYEERVMADVIINCPLCELRAESQGNSPNGGVLFVAENMEDCTEVYEVSITEYRCDNGHVFFM
jgi:hypothetical protein